MTPSSLGAAERSRYPLLSLTSLHQSCPATALAIYSHVSSNCFRGCTNITKQAFAAFTIADIATINHSAPSGTRTHTVPILSRLPLPIGLWGQRKLRWCSLSRPPDARSRKHPAPAFASTEVYSRALRALSSTRPLKPPSSLLSIESRRCGKAPCLHAVRSPTQEWRQHEFDETVRQGTS